MKNLSLIINAILAVAVAILFYLQFSNGQANTENLVSEDGAAGTGEFTVAYVQADSLISNYKYITDQNDLLQKRTAEMERDFQNRAEGLQKEIADYQKNVGNLTIGQARTIEENLGKKEQNLRMFQEAARQELMEKEANISNVLYTRVTEFLKEYSEKNNIQMVVKYNTQSDVLYAGAGLDITKIVVDNLNDKYENKDNSTTAVADSLNNK